MKTASRFAIDHKWLLMFERLGPDRAELERLAGLPSDCFQRGGGLTTLEFFRLWQALATVVDDPAFPISMVENMTTEMFDPPLFAAYCSPDLNTALQRLSKFKPLLCPMRLDVRQTPGTTEIDPVFVETAQLPPPALVALELVFFVQLARMGSRERIVPLEVLSPVELDAPERYREFFGVEPTPSDRMGLVFSARDAARPFIAVNLRMWDFFEPGLCRRLSELTGEESVVQRLRAALTEMLPGGESGMEAVASKLAMSRRTLQRRLAQESTSYQVELGRVREELARHYLVNTDLPSSQISFLLGFDDPNSFFRAFHGWTGSTPERIRSESRPGA